MSLLVFLLCLPFFFSSKSHCSMLILYTFFTVIQLPFHCYGFLGCISSLCQHQPLANWFLCPFFPELYTRLSPHSLASLSSWVCLHVLSFVPSPFHHILVLLWPLTWSHSHSCISSDSQEQYIFTPPPVWQHPVSPKSKFSVTKLWWTMSIYLKIFRGDRVFASLITQDNLPNSLGAPSVHLLSLSQLPVASSSQATPLSASLAQFSYLSVPTPSCLYCSLYWAQ